MAENYIEVFEEDFPNLIRAAYKIAPFERPVHSMCFSDPELSDTLIDGIISSFKAYHYTIGLDIDQINGRVVNLVVNRDAGNKMWLNTFLWRGFISTDLTKLIEAIQEDRLRRLISVMNQDTDLSISQVSLDHTFPGHWYVHCDHKYLYPDGTWYSIASRTEYEDGALVHKASAYFKDVKELLKLLAMHRSIQHFAVKGLSVKELIEA